MAILLELIKCIQKLSNKKSTHLDKFCNESTVHIFRELLIDKDCQLRENAIKLFRYLINGSEVLKVYRKKGIYIFVARIVEKDPKQENMPEIIEAIKFIRRWIIVDASSFPKLLANSLVSLAECNDE